MEHYLAPCACGTCRACEGPHRPAVDPIPIWSMKGWASKASNPSPKYQGTATGPELDKAWTAEKYARKAISPLGSNWTMEPRR